MIASGGHSHIVEVTDYTKFRVIGRTRDDAAGEAFDKAARTMGFPYPGGVYIDKAAKLGNPHAFKLPRPHVDGSPFDFSFSGLKTAVINTVHNAEQKGIQINTNDLAASFQATVCDIISEKLMLALEETGHKKLVLAGGVSANSGLRERLQKDASARGVSFYCPPLPLCGDNAAMVASQGYYEFLSGNIAGSDLNAVASKKIEIE
jgi:N6-L-threonylcarbamoyladenine synthase